MRFRFFFAVVGSPLLALPALGADASAPSAEKTFFEILTYGWQINLILGVFAFAALFFFFHVLMSTRSHLVAPEGLLRQLLDDIASNELEQAQQRAQNDPSLLGQALLPGLRLHDHPVERIHQAVEGAGRRLIARRRQEVAWLSYIGVLSPMLGLLGTVLGMMGTFNVMAQEQTTGTKSMLMATYIGEAMGTTAMGLMVGIAAMAFYYLCLSRVNRIADEVEIASEEAIAALAEIK